LFGSVLVLFMVFRPEGLFPSQRRRQELHAAEEEEDLGELDDEPPADAERSPQPADMTGGQA
jgi:hypothetical protein